MKCSLNCIYAGKMRKWQNRKRCLDRFQSAVYLEKNNLFIIKEHNSWIENFQLMFHNIEQMLQVDFVTDMLLVNTYTFCWQHCTTFQMMQVLYICEKGKWMLSFPTVTELLFPLSLVLSQLLFSVVTGGIVTCLSFLIINNFIHSWPIQWWYSTVLNVNEELSL